MIIVAVSLGISGGGKDKFCEVAITSQSSTSGSANQMSGRRSVNGLVVMADAG